MRIIKVLRDKNTNYKRLKKLQDMKLIELKLTP
jgi:hypothetical protein